MTKTKYLTFILLLILCLIIKIDSVNAISYNEVAAGEKISSDYAFTPKFIKGKTVVKATYEGNEKKITDETGAVHDFYLYDLTKDEYKKAYVKYSNVGKYNGKEVDLVMSAVGVSVAESCEKPTVKLYYYDTSISLEASFLCGEDYTKDNTMFFKVDYYEHGTSNKLDIKSNVTFTDIDLNEGISIPNNQDKVIVRKMDLQHLIATTNPLKITVSNDDYTFIRYVGNTYHTCSYVNATGTKDGQTAECINQSVNPTNCLNGSCSDCAIAGMMTMLTSGSFMFGWSSGAVGVTGTGFSRIDETVPLKTADQKEIEIGKELTYDIEQYVPNQSSNFYYTKWQIEDKISDEFEVEKDDIKIINDADKDVTKLFDIEVEKNIVTITAKDETIASADFYNATYNISIKVTVKKDIDMKDKESIDVTNKASLITNFDTKSSNEVTVKIIPVTVAVPDTGLFVNIGVMVLGVAMIVGGYFLLIKPKKQTVEE